MTKLKHIINIKKYLLFMILLLSVVIIYIYSYISIKPTYSRLSSVGTTYILLEQEKPSHKFMHYFFYPAFWIDYKFTGQEYGILTFEDPYWIFAD